jgi:hypothetical protein
MNPTVVPTAVPADVEVTALEVLTDAEVGAPNLEKPVPVINTKVLMVNPIAVLTDAEVTVLDSEVAASVVYTVVSMVDPTTLVFTVVSNVKVAARAE